MTTGVQLIVVYLKKGKKKKIIIYLKTIQTKFNNIKYIHTI